MPLLDHFHPPLSNVASWTSMHALWLVRMTDNLNDKWLPKEFIAEPLATSGLHPEIDIATHEQPTLASASDARENGLAVAVLTRPTWQVAAPATVFTATFPERFEVQISTNLGERRLVAVIELVSPSNKDRPSERKAFVAKTAAYLAQGVSVVIVDIVTSKRFNLHNDLVDLLAAPGDAAMTADQTLYTVAYRPAFRDEKPEIDVWHEPLEIGKPLPTMPLRLTGDLFVPVELETTYVETCRRRRLIAD